MAVALAALLGAGVPAGAGAAPGCTGEATVRWTVEPTAEGGGEVAGAHVVVPGCPDGDTVGFGVLTDDGPVPAGDLLRGELSGGSAAFDISTERLTVAEVTGVVVHLVSERDGEPPPGAGQEGPQVVERPPPAGPGLLADTGLHAPEVALLGLALVFVGWCLAVGRRKRRAQVSPGGSRPPAPARPGRGRDRRP